MTIKPLSYAYFFEVDTCPVWQPYSRWPIATVFDAESDYFAAGLRDGAALQRDLAQHRVQHRAQHRAQAG